MQMLFKHRGFTLIEIMIVVVILGILATLVIPRIIDRPDQARAVKAKQDIRSLESTLQMYRLDNFDYPTTAQGLKALINRPDSNPKPANWQGPYLDRLPIDPWGNPYIYLNPGEHGTIDLSSQGSDQRQGGQGSAQDIGNWDLQ
jgi:general secretion pathway protein G